MTLKLHNTLTKKLDEFTPITPDEVTLYTCGPTVYSEPLIGNWVAYIRWDLLVRTLQANNYDVKRVMNITDVGHLTDDADDGEDKMEKGARREGITAWDVAARYTESFLTGMKALNLLPPQVLSKATEHIPEQLELIRRLKQNGHTYIINDGIYFDTATFPSYADFANLNLAAMKAGARVEFNPEKRNPSDFALWKFSPKGEKRDMEWETPADLLEGESNNLSTPKPMMGFPGWHIECSAMAIKYLGDTLDIHTGGIDHIPVHHTNEIAQSEAATGKRFANYWLHANFLLADGTKISKSLGNGYTLGNLSDKGYTAMDFRMFVLQSHYRTESNFTWDNLAAAKNRLLNWRNAAALRHQTHETLAQAQPNDKEDPTLAVIGAIREALNDDLNTPEALRLVDEMLTRLTTDKLDDIDHGHLVQFLEAVDEFLGLQLLQGTPDISDDDKHLIIERRRAREEKNWQRSDEIRDDLLSRGISLKDTPSTTIWQYA